MSLPFRCVVLHGCPSDVEKAMNPETRTYDKHWIPWIKEQLMEREIACETPLMPEPWEPVYEKFKEVFEKQIVDESTVLVGHSCGCAFLVRWLGETEQRVAGLILVAPWKNAESLDPLRQEFYGFVIDSMIAERVGRIVMFTSDDEEEIGKESLHMYHAALGGEVIHLSKHGHYTMDDMGTTEFPELLAEIIKIAS